MDSELPVSVSVLYRLASGYSYIHVLTYIRLQCNIRYQYLFVYESPLPTNFTLLMDACDRIIRIYCKNLSKATDHIYK